eukprot:11477808-Alexandrium_andersonii.AAC.1
MPSSRGRRSLCCDARRPGTGRGKGGEPSASGSRGQRALPSAGARARVFGFQGRRRARLEVGRR